MSHKIYDVIIIGAGVSGMTCATLLAQAGKKVLVIEKSCQIQVNDSIHRELLSYQSQVKLSEIFGNSFIASLEGIKTKRNVLKWQSEKIFVKNNHDSNASISINKKRLIQKLHENISKTNLTLLFSATVSHLRIQDEFSEVEVRRHKKMKKYRGIFTVVATGRKAKRIFFNENYKPQFITCGFELKSKSIDNSSDFLIEGILNAGDWWYALPITQNTFYINVSIPLQKIKNISNKKNLIKELFENTNLFHEIFADRFEKIEYHWGGANRWENIIEKKIACIGDAAYVHNPLSGRGIDFGIYSGKILAKQLINNISDISVSLYKNEIDNYIEWLLENEKYWFVKENER